MEKAFLAALLAAGLAAACEISDGDRCPDGYVYDAERIVCIEEAATDADTDADGDTDTDTETETSTEPPTGMGEPCTSDEDCEGYEADFCGINPLTQEGYCTIEDCDMGGCPDGYQCCDCTQSTVLEPGVACLTDDDAGLAAGMGGCTCDGSKGR